MGELLRAEHVAIAIRGREVVSDLSFTLGAGAAVGLVGESGSGKSVACRSLTGTLGLIGGSVTGGRLEILGRDFTAASEREWKRLRGCVVALVPQASLSSLDPLMRIGAQLREAVRTHVHGVDADARSRELLERVNLDSRLLMRRYPHELSGGQRQRVMIALALAGEPEILVADEPTTALDVTVQRSILRELRELCDQDGMALVLVSHDFGVIEDVCDDVVVMYGGCAIETGELSGVIAGARHPYTKALLAARPTLEGSSLRGIDGVPPSPHAWPRGCRFSPRCRFCTEACTSERPSLMPVGLEQQVACVRHEELHSQEHQLESA
jgi:oligopeptide/dipeptide ABC transporter ATP-binding protein